MSLVFNGRVGTDLVECQICKKRMTFLNNKHLNSHNISTKEYQTRFPGFEMMSEKVWKEHSARAQKNNASRIGVKRSPEVREKIIAGIHKSFENGRVGHSPSEETKAAMQEGRRVALAEGRISSPMKGRSVSQETRDKISAALTGIPQGPERYAKAQKTKLERGLPLGPPSFSGYNHSTTSKQAMSKSQVQRFVDNRKSTRMPMIERISNSCLTLKNSICDDVFELKCNVCNYEFTRTCQYFQPSKWKAEICDQCFPKTNVSLAERELKDFISSLTTEKIISPDMETISPLEIDISIPDIGICFEYNGLYWHSEKAGKKPNYHRNKFDQCKNKSFRLISIMEDEWVMHEYRTRGLIKDIISRPQILDLRDCELFDISEEKELYNSFFEDFHFNGTSINIDNCVGIFKDSELVYAVGFSCGTNRNHLIRRQCHKHGLFSYESLRSTIQFLFEDDVEITGYTDHRWEIGDEFIHGNFELDKDIFAQCWYFNSNILSRYTKTEKCVADKSIERIWDCGSTKWILNKKVHQ